MWNSGRRVVEEIDSDSDTQGADLAMTNRRFASDPLRFTGIDLGGGGGSQPRTGHTYQQSDQGESTEDDSQVTSEEDTDDENQAARRELDEALVQSALARIRKAQAKGKQDVKLNKQELAALERRRKRLEAEAEAKRRGDGDRRQRKDKDQRYAVPLAQFDAPPRNALPSTVDQAQQALGPPMGRFPPPTANRARPRSGTSSTSSTYRPQSRAQDSSPFDYQYVHAPPNQRHISDPTAKPSSHLSLPREDEWRPSSSSSREYRDPFQYQTAGPQAPYMNMNSVAAARLSATGSSDPTLSTTRKAVPPTTRSSSRRPRSRLDMNEEEMEDETSSDEGTNGARVARDSGREEIVVQESPSPEPERPRAKKSSSSQPATKRKSGGKKRKGK
ncbi:hypothetical protein GGR53DRAFT_470069 [Hypoxylon sp. FL1150]|nr:hypothetical protein GGR53DRAFT_470069 [Hypoxylon sp. FL1150]